MEHLVVSFRVVAPLLILMAIGVLVRKTGLISEAGFRSANKLVLYVAIPTLIIKNILTCDLSGLADVRFTVFLTVSLLLLFGVLMAAVPLFCRDKKRRGVVIQGLYRTNDAVYGLVIGSALLGEAHMAAVSFAIALSVPIYNILGTIPLELNSGGRPNAGKMIGNVVKNPIVLAVLAGVLVRALMEIFSFSLPAVLDKPLSSLSAMCSPLAFVVLGGLISFSAVKKNYAVLAVCAAVRLVVIPAAALGAALLCGFSGAQLVAVLLIFGAPTSMASFPIACGYDCDSELAGELVAVTTVFSLLTMFAAITIFSVGGIV